MTRRGDDRYDVIVNVGASEDVSSRELRRAVRLALHDAGVGGAEISVTLLGDDEIRALNRRYLDRDHPTDVIAFSLGDDDEGVLGDVYIGLEQADRQARELGVDRAEELVRLAIHGTLHVLGHDHPEGEDRADCAMYRLQERLVGELLGRA